MNNAQSFKFLKACLAQRLAPCGYVGAGDIVWRKVRDTVVVIEAQKDRKYSAKEGVRFTINIGISVDALRDFLSEENGPFSSVLLTVEKCHWRQRLGHLLPLQRDVWWSLRDQHTAQSACSEIASGLIDKALPTVEAMASSEALVRSWTEGRGPGLTEYERRANLARLLIALGRLVEAQTAVQALQDASLGKLWAAAAARDVKNLRNLI